MWQRPCIGPEEAGVDPVDLAVPEPLAALAAPPLFIVGSGRSGTTMVFDLFTRHPEVHAIFESWLLTAETGITGVFHQPQWNPAFYDYQRDAVGHEHAAVQLVSYADAARDLGDLLARWLVRSMPEGKRFLVEKTPADIPALRALFPTARVAHVIRDGRDVVASVARAAESWSPGMGGEDPAVFWRRRVEEVRGEAARLGPAYYELRFEAMRADMAGETRRLYEFAGIPAGEDVLPQLLSGADPQAYTESSRESGFRGQGAVGGWRSAMTREQGRHFDEVAGELLVDLGYAESRDWWRDLPRRR